MTLRNGRTIKYESLVIAMGQKENYHEIKGFDEAWGDLVHPFYTNNDHYSWKTTANKPYRVNLNFNGGHAYFYIPPNNYYGEIEDYNFFTSKSIWDLHHNTGKFTFGAYTSFTIINANDSFCKHATRVNEFIIKKCQESNIKIENNLRLVEVRKVIHQ